jgi:hypothetical protein
MCLILTQPTFPSSQIATLRRYTRMKPSDLIVVSTVGDAAEEGSAAKLHEAAQAAHDLMSKTLEVLDGKIKGLFNAQREQLAQVAERHQQMVKDKVRAFALASHVDAPWVSPAASPTSAPTAFVCHAFTAIGLSFVSFCFTASMPSWTRRCLACVNMSLATAALHTFCRDVFLEPGPLERRDRTSAKLLYISLLFFSMID